MRIKQASSFLLRNSRQRKRQPIRKEKRSAIDAAAKFFQKNLGQAESFLTSRGYSLTDKALTDFGVGYAPMGNLALAELSRAGYSQELLQEVDVLGNSEGRLYDRFRDRLMFPFYDMQGHIIGFSGRIVTPNDETGKYVNTGEIPLFTKGKHIFGLYQARKSIGKTGFAYLVEGQFDVMSLHKVGVENVIGGSGTAFTEDQVKLLLRFTDDIVMIYDADPAGVKTSLKNCELLLKAGAKVCYIRLEKGMDPDEFAKANGSLTKNKLKDLTEPFPKAFKHMILPRGCKDETIITDCLNSICTLVACVQDSVLRLENIKSITEDFRSKIGIIDNKVRSIRTQLKESVTNANIQTGIFGIDALKENIESDRPAIITSIMQDFLDGYGEEPIVFVSGRPSTNDIQELRRVYCYFISSETGCSITDDGDENNYLHTVAEMYCAGIKINMNFSDSTGSFLDYYIALHGKFFENFNGDRVPLVSRCIELTSYADDTVITITEIITALYSS